MSLDGQAPPEDASAPPRTRALSFHESEDSSDAEESASASASTSASTSTSSTSTSTSTSVSPGKLLSKSARSPHKRRPKVKLNQSLVASPLRSAVGNEGDPNVAVNDDGGDDDGDDDDDEAGTRGLSASSAPPAAAAVAAAADTASSNRDVQIESDWRYMKDANGKVVVVAATIDKLIELLAVADALPGNFNYLLSLFVVKLNRVYVCMRMCVLFLIFSLRSPSDL